MTGKKDHTEGFVLILFVFLVGLLSLAGFSYFAFIKSSENEIKVAEETPRELNYEIPGSENNNVEVTQNPQITASNTTLTPTQNLNQKKTLKIKSYGDVDLGGGFIANLKSAWEQNNKIYTEVLLKNNYSSLLGVDASEFGIKGNDNSTRSTLMKEIGLKPGDSQTLIPTFKIIPDSQYELNYYHPVNHIIFNVGMVYAQ